jgi:hypothetical protein
MVATWVSPSSSRNVVMIDANAIRSGTTARKDANTNASTASAPSAPSAASRSRPGPPESWPLSSASASKPVRCTGWPATVVPFSAALAAFSALGFSPNAESGSGCG